jgi:type II secretory pathway component GspD/PulD (secretin)
MTCEECLFELATGSLREMADNSAVMQHCATCPDCSRLTTLLRDREYNAANVLNNLPPMSNPITVAEASVSTAHRRRVGRVVVMLSGAALAVTIWFTTATLILPVMRSGGPTTSTLLTETIPLSCLSPRQAADIIDPYLRTRGSLYYVPTSGISAITVRGTAAQLRKSKDLIRNFESDRAAACRNTAAGSNKVSTTSARTEPKERPEPKERTEAKERTELKQH